MNQHVNCTSPLANLIEADQVGDTLLSAIHNARSGLEEPSLDGQDSGSGATSTNANYRSALEVLRTWDKPAMTLKSAIEAVRFALDEVRDFEAPPIVFPMLAAATSYFDQSNCSEIELLPEGEIILRLASELKVLEDRYISLDEEATTKRNGGEPSFYKTYRDSEMRHVFDRILIIREAIGVIEADSVKSAVVQLAVANTVVADITDSEHTDYEMGRLKRTYDRLIHSAMSVLLRQATLEKSAYAIDHMMAFYRNPWEPYEARVRAIDEKHAGFPSN
ncbi:hypothetical protein FJ417_11275 [Mesorhizobium sp. B3-1-7]|uniref:hypothetical protein n=1 Tax=Mesorhizobium sp. B3-1-7 TaxID=2589894 RepID=UPI00112D02F2|nr:hypothetical protein [Mesorhizobium sp. B3-1-7]TPI60981.1 hypothetical protein FJ417_11275 [Mesorhizobium sp. B3-1-7]